MRISDQRKNEIVAAFQASLKRDNSEVIEAIDLTELRQADEAVGNRDIDAGFRLAMQNRIKALEEKEKLTEQRVHESKIRGLNLITGILLGLVIAGLGGWLFG